MQVAPSGKAKAECSLKHPEGTHQCQYLDFRSQNLQKCKMNKFLLFLSLYFGVNLLKYIQYLEMPSNATLVILLNTKMTLYLRTRSLYKYQGQMYKKTLNKYDFLILKGLSSGNSISQVGSSNFSPFIFVSREVYICSQLNSVISSYNAAFQFFPIKW